MIFWKHLLSLVVVIVSPNISNSTSRFCGTLTDDATFLLSAYYRLLVEKLHKELASLVVTAGCHTMLNWLSDVPQKMFLVIIVMQFLLVNDGIVVVQLLSLVVIVSPNISNSTSRFCGTLNDDAISLLSAYYASG